MNPADFSKMGFSLRDLESRARPLYVLWMLREVEIVNKLGLHARPAALFVRWVNRSENTITIWTGEEKFSGREPVGSASGQFGLRRPCRP